MAAVKAIYHALDLLDRPLLAGAMEDQPLPPDTLALLKIVAGNEEAIASAALATGRSPERIRQASMLYVQRILFAPRADHYRVLGARRDAPQEELRERLGLLMQWLHPDRTKNEWESAFVKRVLAAWDAVKTAERRRAYDAKLWQAGTTPQTRRPRITPLARRIPWIAGGPVHTRARGRRRVGRVALGGAIMIAALLVPDWPSAPTSTSADARLNAVAGAASGNAAVDSAAGGP